ncbi:MAG TPA: glycosyltransferase [Oligoflexia bacterium]|nr:glycosyltransferase [Oligoflexia bacterium]HMP47053.1 glycosyltransferase [Oligoflexia bacterium]
MHDYSLQFILMDPHNPMLGYVDLWGLIYRAVRFLGVQAAHFSEFLTAQWVWISPELYSPLVVLPVLLVLVGLVNEFLIGNRFDVVNSDDGKINLLYVGVITIERGLEDVIRALFLMRDLYPEYFKRVRLVIAGGGNYKNHLLKLVNELGLSDAVRFPGWVPFSEISAQIRKSFLCLVPHVNNEFINTTIPNKIFQYMAMSKPILVSNAEPLRRIVEEGRCGYVFNSGDPSSVLDQILMAVKNPLEGRKRGEAGRALVEARYNWDITKKAYLDVIENW